MALYHHRDRFITLNMERIWPETALLQKRKNLKASIMFSLFYSLCLLMMLFRVHALNEMLSISKMDAEFQGPGCTFAIGDETQEVGYRNGAGHYSNQL